MAGLFFLRTFSDLCSHGNTIIRLYLPLLTSQQPDSVQLCTKKLGALHVSLIPQSYAQQSCFFWVSSASISATLCQKPACFYCFPSCNPTFHPFHCILTFQQLHDNVKVKVIIITYLCCFLKFLLLCSNIFLKSQNLGFT